MVKKLTLSCNFPSGKTPVNFYIGEPSDDSHPIAFQSQWLATEYGGSVPSEIMDSMEKLQKISIKNKISFEDLCEHVFKEVEVINLTNKDKALRKKQISHIKQNDPVISSSNKPAEPSKISNEPTSNE